MGPKSAKKSVTHKISSGQGRGGDKSKRRNKNELSQARTRVVSRSIGIFISLLICIFGILIAIEYQLIFKPSFKVSQILAMEKQQIQQFLGVLDGKMDRGDPGVRKERGHAFTSLIKPHLTRVQGRISSLKIQTAQYEQMPTKIPGGPKSFIDSSIEEIDSLMTELLILDKKAMATLNLDHPLSIPPEEKHPLSLVVFPKIRPFAQDPAQQRVMADNGINLWPDAWGTEDWSLAKKYYDDAINSNVTLEEAMTSLKQAAEALGGLIPLFLEYEELQKNVKRNYFLKSTVFPAPIAKFLYRSGIGIGSRTEYFEVTQQLMAMLKGNMDFDTKLPSLDNPEELQSFQNDFAALGKSSAQFLKILEAYSKNERVLKNVLPMRHIYVERAKTFVDKMVAIDQMEKEDRNNNLVIYAGLKNEVFEELGQLRERVINLGTQ